MAGGMQMTWDDWNPYLGVDYRLTGTVALICLLGAVILEIRAFGDGKPFLCIHAQEGEIILIQEETRENI